MSSILYKVAPVMASFMLFCGSTLSAQQTSHPLADTVQDWQILMHGDAEFVIAKSRLEIKLIKSAEDWIYFVNQMRSDAYHPLIGIYDIVLTKFSTNLQFGEFGLAGAYLGGIEKEISHYNYVRLWEYFGMTEDLAAEFRGNKCTNAGTIRANPAYLSTSNCHP